MLEDAHDERERAPDDERDKYPAAERHSLTIHLRWIVRRFVPSKLALLFFFFARPLEPVAPVILLAHQRILANVGAH